VQAYNGRAIIKVKLNKGKSVASVKSEGMPTIFETL
jgi:beta-galactosidase